MPSAFSTLKKNNTPWAPLQVRKILLLWLIIRVLPLTTFNKEITFFSFFSKVFIFSGRPGPHFSDSVCVCLHVSSEFRHVNSFSFYCCFWLSGVCHYKQSPVLRHFCLADSSVTFMIYKLERSAQPVSLQVSAPVERDHLVITKSWCRIYAAQAVKADVCLIYTARCEFLDFLSRQSKDSFDYHEVKCVFCTWLC